MKVLVVGLGSIAQKHVYILRELVPDVEIFALRSSIEARPHKNITDLYSWQHLQDHRFHFVLISSPSSMHLEHIKKLMVLQIPLMIEKPIFVDRQQINIFKDLPKNDVLMYVASNFRFHPVIEFLKGYLKKFPSKVNEVTAYCGSYLPSWRPNQDYRKVYSARSELGGGVHLDLIHEPDYLVHLFGMPDESQTKNRKVSDLEINSFDTSIIVFGYSEFQAQVTLNYFRKDAKRTLEIVRENSTLKADFINGKVIDLVSGEILFENQDISVYITYERQMKYFLNCIANNIKPMNSPDEAVEILKCLV